MNTVTPPVNGAAKARTLANCKKPLDVAIALLCRGLWPVVIYPRGAEIPRRDKPAEGKEPIGAAWGAERLALGPLTGRFKRNPGAGVGVCLGPGRGPDESWLIDVEGDGPEAEASRAILFGDQADGTMGWGSARGGHGLWSIDPERLGPLLAGLKGYEGKGPLGVGVYKVPELPGLELRIGGYKPDGTVKQVQSVVPPTPGTNGEPRRWNDVGTIAKAPDAFYEALERFQAKPEPKVKTKPAADPFIWTVTASGDTDPEARARAYLATVDPAVSGQRGHDRTFYAACKLVEFGLGVDAVFRLLWEDYNPRCDPQWTEAELRHKAEDAVRENADKAGAKLNEDRNGYHGGNGRAASNGPPPADATNTAGTQPKRFKRTDTGNAERLAHRHGKQLLYCHQWRKWLFYDGRRWAVDNRGIASRLAKDTARSIYAEAATVEDDDERKEVVKWATTSESAKARNAMLQLACSELPVDPDQLDRDPWLLNVNNGTIDLRTGELRSHRREDLISSLCPLPYDPNAECPLWLGTLDLFFGGNEALISYWQRICGYALAGVVRDHLMPVAYGTGNNGKSTILGTLLNVLGTDYAMKATDDLLMAKRNDGHPTDKADLFGKRLVVAIETESGRRLNETTVKELTGGDRIRARRMREDFWEFAPTHTLILATNHKPAVQGTDHGIWRRLKLVPFAVKVDSTRDDKAMPEKLRAEFPGILAWCVRGCLAWQKEGLNAPPEVDDATESYRKEEDVLGDFLAEHCLCRPEMTAKAGPLYARYRKWTEGSGEVPKSQKRFGQALTERGFERYTNNGTWYRGLGLRSEADETPDPNADWL